MTEPDLVDRLAAHRTIGTAPREELAWLASHGSLRHLDTGDMLTAKNVKVENLYVVLSGCIAIYVDRGAGLHKIIEWRDGGVPGVRSPIEQAEREEAIADWLADHGFDVVAAETFAETGVTIDALDRLAGAVPGPALNAGLRWAAAGCSVRSLAAEIRESATRISDLVAAIKGFTHMDQAAIAEPVNLIQSLGNTVAVLRAKARNKSAAVVIDVEPDLPRVRGFVGELNQIWANLIDNALDAIPDSGRVEVRANRERQRVVVRIVDNGSGIPAQIRERIFDPFFTTKPVGQGTGLGLDIVRRLVRHNDGEITVESQPGRTEFRVVLPPAESEAGGGKP